MDEKTPAIIRPKPALEIRLTPAGSEKSVRPTDSPSDRDKSSFDRDKPSFSKPRRPDVTPPKPWIELEEAQNQGGEVFHLGDLIEVRAPWGDVAIAEIQNFYEVSPGSLWACFGPTEERENWSWKGGSIRTELLKKA
jgi:hypothetical protein